MTTPRVREILPGDAVNELERREAIQPGMLVYYDTMRSGLVPCKVIDRKPGRFSTDPDRLTLEVTGARYAYPRGLVFETTGEPFVQAREPRS